jgi:hypothetical protein
MQYSSLDEPESAAAVAAAAVAAALSANNNSNNNNNHHHGSSQSTRSRQSQTRVDDHHDNNNNNDDAVSYKTNKSNKSNRTRGGRTIHSELEEPLNDVELGGPSSYNNSHLDDDPFYVLRGDLYRKLELVDEGLAEFLRIVYQTVCI